MDVEAAVERVAEAGPIGERWGSVVLVRNRRAPAESERAYDMVPIVEVRLDETVPDVELVMQRPAPGERVAEMQAQDVAARLRELMPGKRDWELRAADTGGMRAPIVAVYLESRLDALMFVQWFEGYEREL